MYSFVHEIIAATNFKYKSQKKNTQDKYTDLAQFDFIFNQIVSH